ncbi:hypothetical protein DFJ73DRAFT_940094, partial [Zopfochytrium polystomum]
NNNPGAFVVVACLECVAAFHGRHPQKTLLSSSCGRCCCCCCCRSSTSPGCLPSARTARSQPPTTTKSPSTPAHPHHMAVFIDKQIFAATLAVVAGIVEAALAKAISVAYLAAGQPGVGLAVRLGFSGRSPWSGRLARMRDAAAIPALLAMAAYAALAAIRTVDTLVVASLPQPVTWTSAALDPNRSFNLQVVAELPHNFVITPAVAAAIYDGYSPPFDSTGQEWFAMVAKTPPSALELAPSVNFTDVFVKRNDRYGFTFAKQLEFRDLAVREHRKRDTVLAVGFGYYFQVTNLAWTEASRPIMIPFDMVPGSRTYSFLDVAAVKGDIIGYNLTAEIAKVKYTRIDPLPDSTDVSTSVCVMQSNGFTAFLLAVITPSPDSDRSHFLTVDSTVFNITSAPMPWSLSLCGGLSSFASIVEKMRNRTTLLAETHIYSAAPTEFLTGTAPTHTLIDVDLWLPGPAAGAVEYVEYAGDLLSVGHRVIAATVVFLCAAVAFVLWPAMSSENLAYAACADVESRTAAGWSWALLVNRYGHAVVAGREAAGQRGEDVTRKVLEREVLVEEGAEYGLKTVEWRKGGPLARVVAGAKSAAIPL